MNPHILSDYPTPIVSRYYIMERKAKALRPEFKIAMDHLIDIVEIYLQTLTFIGLAELYKFEGQGSKHINEIVETIRSSAMSTGHWLSVLKLSANEFLERHGSTTDLFGSEISKLLGVGIALLDEINQWPTLRNATKHDYTKDESAAEVLYKEYRPRLESLLTKSHFLGEITFFVIKDASLSEIENLYEISCFHGLDPDRNIFLIKTNPEIKLFANIVFVARRILIDSGQIRSQNEYISLDPWILAPKQDSGLIYFNSCKRKKILYQDTAINSEGRWEDIEKYKIITNYLNELVKRIPKKISNSIVEEWIAGLRVISPVIITNSFRQSDPSAFFHGQPISIDDLAADWDIRRILYSNENPIEYENFFSKYLETVINEEKGFLGIPVIALLGPGGAGKTTVLWRICFDLANTKKILTLRILPAVNIDVPLAVLEIKLAMEQLRANSVALFIDEAAPLANDIGNLIKELRFQNINAIILLAEQLNHSESFKFEMNVFELRNLTDLEVDKLLIKLADAGCLGYLEKLSLEERKSFFLEYSKKEILVALRESMEGGKRFDQIVYEEFRNIPDKKGQELYRVAALYHASETFFPLDACRRYLGTNLSRDAWRTLRASCRGVVSEEIFAGGFKVVRGRHRIISSILIDKLYLINSETSEFFDDLDSTFESICDSLTPLTNKIYTKIIRNISTAEAVLKRLQSSSDADSLCYSICRFELTYSGKPNFFFLSVVTELVAKSYVDYAITLLQASCRLKISATPGQVWQRLAHLLIKRKHEGDLDLAVNAAIQAIDYRIDSEELTQSILVLSKALKNRHHLGDRDQAIDMLKKHFIINNKNVDIDSLVIQLSILLEERNLEGDVSYALEIIQSTLNDRSNLHIDHNSSLLVRFSQILEHRNTLGDLDKAIDLLLVYYYKNLPSSIIAIRLCGLLECRNSVNYINEGISLLEKTLLNDLSPDLGTVAIKISKLLENRADDGDIDQAIIILEKFIFSADHVMDMAVVTRLIDCLSLRGSEFDVCRSIEIGESALNSGVDSGHFTGIVFRVVKSRLKRNIKDDLFVSRKILNKGIINNEILSTQKSFLVQLLMEVEAKNSEIEKGMN